MAKPHLGAVPRQPGRSRRRRGVLAALLGSVLACCAAVNADEWIYVVRPGDTLWTLTERHLKHFGYVTRLQAANGVDNPYALPPGMRLRIPLDWSRRRPGVARVVGHGGTCTLARDGGAAPVGIAMGAELSVGDEVTCAANSYVTLEFEDGSQLRVQPDSQIHLDAAWVYGDAGYFVHDVALQRGRTESSVPQQQPAATRLRIVTPASTTSVRGTRFRVAADESDAASRSEVEHGRVSVDAQRRSVSVDAGFGSVTRAGAAPSPPVPLLPAPDLSDVPAVLERVPLRFSLAGLPGATGYRGGVAADAKFTRLIAEFSSDSTTLRGPDIPDGDYWLRVRGRDAEGLEGRHAVRRFTLNARPEPPFVLQPQAGGNAGVTPEFAWTAHPQADHYEIEVAGTGGFEAPLIAERDLRDTRFRAPAAMPPGQYTWRIATVSSTEGRGPNSDAMPFRVPYPGPSADPPALSRDRLVIQWARPAPGQTFWFQLASDAEFKKLRVDQAVAQPRVDLPRPGGGRYFLRIRTIEADGFAGPFGEPQQITVPHSRWWLLILAPLALLA
ncbi:MAG: FecR domain-containing protein [Immundisolibacter sp.]|uniref:FecR domain-containing protein n=1 Tax=Immundisolibacter sp. TaxID=1934948 RepID=UPI003D0A0B66